MNVIVVLILFSALMAFVCAKARAAVPALISGVFCAVLICSIFNGLPGAIADGSQGVGDTGANVVSSVTDK